MVETELHGGYLNCQYLQLPVAGVNEVGQKAHVVKVELL